MDERYCRRSQARFALVRSSVIRSVDLIPTHVSRPLPADPANGTIEPAAAPAAVSVHDHSSLFDNLPFTAKAIRLFGFDPARRCKSPVGVGGGGGPEASSLTLGDPDWGGFADWHTLAPVHGAT